MFRESKEYRVLSEIREAMELYETSYSVLKNSKDIITRHYPGNTKKSEYLQEFRRVKDRVDFVKGRISSIPVGTEAFGIISKEIRSNLYLTDEYLNLFVEKYSLNSDSADIPVRAGRRLFKPSEELIENLCGNAFKKQDKKVNNNFEDNIDSLRNYIDNDDIESLKQSEDYINVAPKDKSSLITYYKDRIAILKKHNASTIDLEEKLKRLEKDLPKPEVKLTKNQKKKIVSPFRNKMSACHKSYNNVKGDLVEEDVINIFQETLDIEADFLEVCKYLNEVDLNELNSLLKRIDKLAIDFPGLLTYDFSGTRNIIEECKENMDSSN